MKLYASPTSPYARLVRIVLAEKGGSGRVEIVWTNPWKDEEVLLTANPFARVPTLEDDDGTLLNESAIISLFLEQRFPKPTLVPPQTIGRVYHKLGRGQGLIDATVGVIAPQKFGDSGPDDALVRRRRAVIDRAIPTIAVDSLGDPARPDLGDIAVAVALAYVSLRLPDVAWRDGSPRLANWLDRMAERPSFVSTAPE